jgi:hypothetical protein
VWSVAQFAARLMPAVSAAKHTTVLSPSTNRHGANTECPFKDRMIKKVFEGAGQVMRKLHAKCVSASESGGEYFQVLFEREQDGDRAYFLIQRQFEIPDDGTCYVETHIPEACGYFRIRFAELDRNRFRIELPGKKEWDITFETDDDNYEKVKSILGAILSAPHHLVFGQNS